MGWGIFIECLLENRRGGLNKAYPTDPEKDFLTESDQ